MKKQSTIFDNEVRVKPLQEKVVTRINLKVNESGEYLCKSGAIVIVTKREAVIQGVTLKKTVYY